MGLKQNSDLRLEAREGLKGYWADAVVAALISSIIIGLVSNVNIMMESFGEAQRIINLMWIPTYAYTLLVSNIISYGIMVFYLRLFTNWSNRLEEIFSGYKNFGNVFALMFLMNLFIFLWSLLFLIPGIIAAYRYSMAVYIMAENPGTTPMDAIRRSKELTQGVKGKIFELDLSFIGWAILCIFTCGIGFLWLTPYWNMSRVAFYQDLKITRLAPPAPEQEEVISLEEWE
ncbi:MAG: DUF975 family protein [Clostridia bacterium]